MKYIQIGILLCAAFILFPVKSNAQRDIKIEVNAVVLDSDRQPIIGSSVSIEDSNTWTTTDEHGEFSLKVVPGDVLLVKAIGYITRLISASENLTEIILVPDGKLIQTAFKKVNEKDVLGGVVYVDVPELMDKNYFDYSLDNMNAYANGYHGNLWGNNEVLVLVDGIPRDANNVLPSEIDQITFLKSASAVALYGSRAAKGVISITTKRGKSNDRDIKVRANTGIFVPKSYPEYLGSAEYMTLYNEARANDDIGPLYSDEQIYNHSTGSNPYRYPDVNYYSSDHLKKFFNRSDVYTEITGGNDRARFYTNIGFYHQNDLLDVGEAKKNNITRLNLRGNIDVRLNDFITSQVNANVTFYDARSAFGDYWNQASILRPNSYTPLIPVSLFDENDYSSLTYADNSTFLIDGKYLLGGKQDYQTNPFADMYAAGYSKFTSRQFQFDAVVDFDLERVLKGLTFKTQFAIDYSTTYNQSYNNTYSVYEPIWNNYAGEDRISYLIKHKEDKKSGSQNLSNSWQRQTLFFSGQFDYKATFEGAHNISATLLGHGYQQKLSTVYHRTSNVNLGLQVGYNYLQKYYIDFSGALVHSARLAPGKRTAFSPTASLGWRISSEDFLAGSDVVDNLKLTASAGILNTDLDISDYYMYNSYYTQGDGTWWGWKEGVSLQSTDIVQGGNPNLTFAKRKEISVEVDASFFKKLIEVNASVFTSRMTGLVIQPVNSWPSYMLTYWPSSTFIPFLNFNNDKRMGYDFSIKFNKQIQKVDFTLGVVGTYYKTEAEKVDELKYTPEEYDRRTRVGRPLDGIWGLECEGFFSSQDDIDNHALQTFSDVKPGDLKYKDQNGDGVIDEKDRIHLGRGGWYGSPFTLGINLTAKWNNFSLFALVTGGYGSYAVKNSTYHWVYGDRKYSAEVRDRWTVETAETATYPRLTTKSGSNNFQTSDFWLYNTDRLNISKIQLSYDFPREWLQNSFIRELGFYVSGANLLTIAKERETLEMNVGGSPQTRFYNLGVKATF